MQPKQVLSVVCFFVVVAFTQSVRADNFYSVASLTLLCGNGDSRNDAACKTYLHGVVETWMLKDVVSVEPYRFLSRKNQTFCETILKVSDNEWLAIVRGNLNSMEPGFAADAVMKALAGKLCK